MTDLSSNSALNSREGRIAYGPLETVLRLFGDVRAGEGVTVMLLMANLLLLLVAYYILKVAREPLILLGGGAELKSYASVGQSLLLVGVATAYGWLASRVGRVVLIACVTTFFVVNLLIFWFLGARGIVHGVGLGLSFFLWVGIFNLVTIAQFWSFVADIYDEEQGKRLVPVIGIGSSFGAVGGAAIADRLVRLGSPFPLMLVSAAILMTALVLTYAVDRREVGRRPSTESTANKPVDKGNAFELVLRDRFLLLIAALILLLNIVTKTGDYVFDRMLIARAAHEAAALGVAKVVYIGEFKARYFESVNVLEIVLQSFLVSRIIKYGGLRIALVSAPLVSLLGYMLAFALSSLHALFGLRVAESALDYSLSNTSRQALWLVVSREAKYKGKQVVDSFVWRAGDVLSAAVVWTGVHFNIGLRWFLAVNAMVCGVWVAAAFFTGVEYLRRRDAAPAKAQD